MRTRSVIGLGAAVMLASAALCFDFGAAQEAKVEITAGPLPTIRTAASPRAGRIELPDCRITLIDEVTLSAERSGVLDHVAAEGDMVKAGDVVAHTRDDVLRAQLAIAERQAANDVEIRFARKMSELKQLEYVRSLDANQKVPGTVSELTLREQRLEAERALLQLEQAEFTREIERLKAEEIQEHLKTHQALAPIAGLVRKVHRRVGEAVREGEAILELAHTGRVRVEGDLPVIELARVSVGTPVEVRVDLRGADPELERRTFAGRIEFVDVKVEPVTGTVKVRATVINPDGALKDGLNAAMACAGDVPAPARAAQAPPRRTATK